ncbi:MAG: DUF5132 domain-containing protein [Vicinamibacterales bacterium]
MLTAIVSFLLGVFLAPVVRPLFRPVFVELVKVSILTADEARRAAARVREDMEDAVAEAGAERTTRARKATAQAASAAESGTTAQAPDSPSDPPPSPR